MRASCQFVKAYCGVNVIAQHSFARIYVPREKALNRFAQQLLAKCRIAPRPRLNRLFEILRERRHYENLNLTW